MGEALDRDCGHACVRLHWRGSLVPWRCLGGLRGWHVRMVLHPLRDLRWRGRICCWRAWISQQVHPGLVRHHASHCHCRLVHYPAGYFFGYLMGGVNDCSLNLIYNLADFVNKIAFCLAIWQAAKNETLDKGAALLPA